LLKLGNSVHQPKTGYYYPNTYKAHFNAVLVIYQ